MAAISQPKNETSFRGWIPTVTGRLSFSHFGDYAETLSARRADQEKRYLVAHQWRTIGDALIPEAFQPMLGIQPRAHFVCIAQTNDIMGNTEPDKQGIFEGTIFIIDDESHWRKVSDGAVSKSFEKLASYDALSSVRLEDYFSNQFLELKKHCGENCGFQADFRLLRSGIVDFTVLNSMTTRDEPPTLTDAEKRMKFGLAHQTYSFLKDLGHQHKHHSPRNDTIIDLHNYLPGGDDKSWRRKTLYGIYRRIITCMRREDIVEQISSLGLLAYARAFKRIWAEQYPEDDQAGLIPVFFDSEMQESIRASELKMRFALQQKGDQNSAFRTLTLAVAALTISVAGLVKLTDATQIHAVPNELLTSLAKGLLMHPLQLVGPFIAAFYIPLIVWPRYIRPTKWRWMRVIQTILQPFSRPTAINILYSIGAFLLILGFYVLWGVGWPLALWQGLQHLFSGFR